MQLPHGCALFVWGSWTKQITRLCEQIPPCSDFKTCSGIAPSVGLTRFNPRAELLPDLRISMTSITLIYQSERGVALVVLEFIVVHKWHFHQQKNEKVDL